MPGSVDYADPVTLRGWAKHPHHAAYPMTVHAIGGGRVIATVLADRTRDDHRCGFALTLPEAADRRDLHILLGETDEVVATPDPSPLPRRQRVEDLIATRLRRPWVNGACSLDAVAAGLLPPTIIDLLCRDFLGRPAVPPLIASATVRLAAGGFDAVRQWLIDSADYTYRRIYADQAPGAIFSQAMVRAVGGRDFTGESDRAEPAYRVSAPALLALDDAIFVTECYRQILRKEPDAAGMAHYLGQLAGGMAKAAIVRHLSCELEAVSAGVLVTDLPSPE